MKKILIAAFVLILSSRINAQIPGGMNAGSKSMPNSGHIYGKVIDSTNKAIADVSVVLMQKKFDSTSKQMKDVFLKAAVTKGKGEFDFDELPTQIPLTLKISASGYKTIQQNISFMPSGNANGQKPAAGASGGMPSFDKDLGNIKLFEQVTTLKDVVVVSTKPMLSLSADKKIFNVEKNIVSAGGTAVDVMKNVPSLQVDIDGNVLLRNSTPQLFIDGRPTTLTLDQIPADAIESVEVITNPSAKYDASGGGAGILNIVLKKNKKQGYNGSVRIGADDYGGVNGGADLNLRQGKVNLTASFNGNIIRDNTTSATNRLDLSTVPELQINQQDDGKNKGNMNFSRLGADYFISNRTTLSLIGFMVNADFKPGVISNIYTDSVYSSGKVSAYSQRLTNSERAFNGKGFSLGIKHLFPKDGEEWTADVNYFSGNSTGTALYTTNYYTGASIASTDLQKVLSDGNDQNLIIQSDYVKPITSLTKLETGVRASIRSRLNDNYNYVYSKSGGGYELIPSPTSNYSNKDNVYAAYATISSSIKNFSYKAGLRAESSSYAGVLASNGQEYNNQYPISLFPSIFLSQKLSSTQDLQLSYSRRINRPNFFQLIPYADSTDKLNITKGNPDLVPEFTQSLEMSYMKRFKGGNSILASVYYKYTENLITRYLYQDTDPLTGNTALINTYINANSSYNTGLELTSINNIAKWLDISTNINLYNSKVNTSNVTTLQQNAMWSWFGKFNGNFKLPSNFTVQLSAMYQSKTNLPVNSSQGMMGAPGMQAQSASQGYIKSFYGVDLAIKKTFLKDNAAAVTLSVNDIFRSRINDQYSYSDYFVQDYNRLRNPQIFRLTFSYRFGKIDMNLFKRKTAASLQAGSDSMQQ